MKTLMTALAIGATIFAFTGPVLADEVIIHRDTPVEVVPAAPPSDVVIEHRRPDCATTTTHRENYSGDYETVTRRDCD